MGTDPLSSATRTAKRNLLLAATVAITYAAFDVSVSKIPIGGLAIEFDNRVFAFLLIVVLSYFLSTFVLYYCIDIQNIEKTKHQSDKEKHYQDDVSDFWKTHAETVLKAIGKSFPENVGYNSNAAGQLAKYFKDTQGQFFEENMIDGMASAMAGTIGLHKKPTKRHANPTPIHHSEDPALYEKVEKRFREVLLEYRRKEKIHRLSLLPGLYGVRSLYLLRNYLVDGGLPFFLALIAMTVILQLIDLHWLRTLVPTPRV